MDEKKVVDFKIEGDKFIICVDTNKDGENLIEIKINLLEVPDEVVALIKK
jgi:hypothetical protein